MSSPSRRSDRLYDIGFFLVEAFAAMEVTAVIVANVEIAKGLGIDLRHGDWILNFYLYPLFAAMFLLLFGATWLHRRVSPVRFFIGGLLFFALGNGAAACAATPAAFFAARVAMGLGAALAFAGQLWTLSLFHRPRLQKTLVWGEAGAALGVVAGPMVGALFVHAHATGWRWFFVFNGVLGLATALFAWTGLRGRAAAGEPDAADEPAGTRRLVRAMTAWQVAVSILIVGTEFLFSDYMQKEAGRSPMFVGGMTALASLGAIVGSVWAARMPELGHLPKWATLGLLTALGTLALCLEQAWYGLAGAPIFAAGLCMGLASVSIYANIVKVSHPSRFLARSMVYLIGMQVGNALGVQMVGLAERRELPVLGTALLVAAGPACVTLAILARARLRPVACEAA